MCVCRTMLHVVYIEVFLYVRVEEHVCMCELGAGAPL